MALDDALVTARLEQLGALYRIGIELLEIAPPQTWSQATRRSLPLHGRVAPGSSLLAPREARDIVVFTGPSARVFHVGDWFDAWMTDTAAEPCAVVLVATANGDTIPRDVASVCVLRPLTEASPTEQLALLDRPSAAPFAYLTSRQIARVIAQR